MLGVRKTGSHKAESRGFADRWPTLKGCSRLVGSRKKGPGHDKKADSSLKERRRFPTCGTVGFFLAERELVTTYFPRADAAPFPSANRPSHWLFFRWRYYLVNTRTILARGGVKEDERGPRRPKLVTLEDQDEKRAPLAWSFDPHPRSPYLQRSEQGLVYTDTPL